MYFKITQIISPAALLTNWTHRYFLPRELRKKKKNTLPENVLLEVGYYFCKTMILH